MSEPKRTSGNSQSAPYLLSVLQRPTGHALLRECVRRELFEIAHRNRVDAVSILEVKASRFTSRTGNRPRSRRSNAFGDSSYKGHMMDALAARGDEGRRSLR